MCNAFVFCLKKEDIFLEKAVLIYFMPLVYSYVYIHIALCYQQLYLQVSNGAKIRNRYNQVPHLTQDINGKVTNSQKTPVIIWPCNILYSENYHQLFKH